MMTTEEKFWLRVNKDGPVVREDLGPCWTWTKTVTAGGYGVFCIRRGRNALAHRFAMGICERGQPGIVCHRCDNPPCVNPAHLWVGTKMENSMDSKAKGREKHFFGDVTPWAKLTAGNARDILKRWQSGERTTHLAKEYGVSRRAIYNITSGQKWKHAITGKNVWETAHERRMVDGDAGGEA